MHTVHTLTLEGLRLVLLLLGLFLENSSFLTRERELTAGFLLASFQLGLLTLQLLLIGQLMAVGVGQHAHALRVSG